MTIADLIRRNGTDPAVAPRPFLGFGEREISHAEFYAESIRFARLFLAIRDPAAPFHVGVLMDNVPEYLLAFGGAALAGAVVVGINSTQRGAALARDIAHADCQILLIEPSHLPLLEPIRDGVITAEYVHAELGQLLTGALPGRTTPEQITLYKSVGVAEEDAAIGHVLAAARNRGLGTHIDL